MGRLLRTLVYHVLYDVQEVLRLSPAWASGQRVHFEVLLRQPEDQLNNARLAELNEEAEQEVRPQNGGLGGITYSELLQEVDSALLVLQLDVE